AGLPAVRTWIPKKFVGTCANGRYIVGLFRRLNQSWMTSPLTPTTVIQDLPVFMRRPIGSSPGQYFFAIDSLTTTTGAVPSRSAAVKPRPLAIGIRITEK